ncbi:hypothetical protein IWW36_003245 [Coemansia brasiliensis]|uniref:Uncharacterized protein n=1 Tax=Coemansia brasiliensis TaxID=2650707 RepID=A0A9W8LZX4_9FUNG|nr:hypothetical protein IWW36_003245 [Coemansia brasiliensis]
MSSVPYQQSPSLVSLPMLPRPSTAAMASSLALPTTQYEYQKRPRVNSKAGTLGSLFRTKMHTKRSSTAGSDSMSPALEAQDAQDASWGVGIDYPAVSPLFTDESLQQLLGSSPQLSAHSGRRPSSPSLSGTTALPEAAVAAGSQVPMSPASARRSKREIAASVLHNSAGPFRRLRSGPANKTMSFPPASSENSLFENVASDEFVVVTPDMCPPAALVSSSVISGVSPLEASAAVAVAASSGTLSISNSEADHGRGPSLRAASARRNQPRVRGMQELRTRALTQVSRSSEHLLLLRDGAYEESTESLVRISTPSLSASSSEASLPLSQATTHSGSSQILARKQVPAPLVTGAHNRATNGLSANAGQKPKLRQSRFVGAQGTAEDRRLSRFTQLDALSPYTVNRLHSTAAQASERRRRPTMHQKRRSHSGSISSANWTQAGTSDTTLPNGAAHTRHVRNLSDTSDYAGGNATFDFQIQSADSEFWPDESPVESDVDELEQQIADSGFPSSGSAHFDFEVGRDTEPSCGSPRQRSRSSGAVASRELELRNESEHSFPIDAASPLDPSSPISEEAERTMALNILARPRRMRAYTTASPDSSREANDNRSSMIPDQFDFDGSTLTQTNDWQLMNASSSDGEQPPQMHSHPRRRVRKRRVLPKTMFQMTSDKRSAGTDYALSYKAAIKLQNACADSSATALQAVCETPIAVEGENDTPRVTEASAVVTAKNAHAETPKTVVAAIAASPELQMLLNLELIPRLPQCIERDLHIGQVARLTLACSGDADSWQPARIPCFVLRLGACVARAHGLCELTLVNLGLTAIPRSLLQCVGLQRLNMAHNWIGAVPGWLAQMRGLEHISLPGNPLRTVSADLVEMRQRLATLDFGNERRWALLNRRPPPPPPLSSDEKKLALAQRLQSTAIRRLATAVSATRLNVTQRQHEAALDRATRMLAMYSNALYSTLREPRNWGHSVALPFPTHSSLS